MTNARLMLLTALAMLAFAGNSLLCRLALKNTSIDAASFTTVRMLSASAMLIVLLAFNQGERGSAGFKADMRSGNWLSALALFAYAAAFSFAYMGLTAATGALLLFGAVQASMISYGLIQGERLRGWRLAGFLLAVGGLVALLLPGLSAPPVINALLMLLAGIAWGVYTLRGKGATNPLAMTSGNFFRTVPMTLAMSGVMAVALAGQFSLDAQGVVYAVLSGALTSGVGYAIWYKALPALKATAAATVQLSVPVIAALGGVVWLGEPLTGRMVAASCAILLGVALVLRPRSR